MKNVHKLWTKGELELGVNLSPSMVLHALPNDCHKCDKVTLSAHVLARSFQRRQGRAGALARLLDVHESLFLFVLFPEQAEQKSSLRLLKLPTVLKSLHGK